MMSIYSLSVNQGFWMLDKTQLQHPTRIAKSVIFGLAREDRDTSASTMRPIQLFLAVLSAALVRAESQTAAIYLQPITSPEAAPSFLADVTYDTTDVSASTVTEYEAPELPEDAKLIRIGVYDRAAKRWASSTSVASVDNFSKGYSLHVTVSVDAQGQYLGASCRGVGIDAGQTRDFGPQAMVVVTEQGKQPDLNRPVVLSPEGKQVVPEEKSILQKYVSSVGDALAQLANMSQVLVGVCCRTVPPHVTGRRGEIEYNDFYINICFLPLMRSCAW